MFDYLVVGAGFAGSVIAERLARGSGKRVLIVDKRPHIGGNAYDHYDDAGLLVHRYGPHLFHTNSAEVFAYLSRFTSWHSYEHRVLHKDGTTRMIDPMTHSQIEFVGVPVRGLTCFHRREPGSAPSRLKAYAMRELAVTEVIPQKNWAMTEMNSRNRPRFEPAASMKICAGGRPISEACAPS